MRPWGNYSAYDLGIQDDVFVKINGENLIAYVWPNQAHFPDWFHPNTTDWWQRELYALWFN